MGRTGKILIRVAVSGIAVWVANEPSSEASRIFVDDANSLLEYQSLTFVPSFFVYNEQDDNNDNRNTEDTCGGNSDFAGLDPMYSSREGVAPFCAESVHLSPKRFFTLVRGPPST